ncbi:MAG: gliding motility-associated C-terminal domain-containing protein, partial [Flavobacteriaceae bacterium]
PRQQTDVFYHFSGNDAFEVGANDRTKINGYAAVSNQETFTFPVGDIDELRSLVLNSQDNNPLAKCAYFREDPNTPSTLSRFDTSRLGVGVTAVSSTEFWHLQGQITSTVSISWNLRSNMVALAPDAESVILVGFNNTTNQWERLSETGGVGSLTEGFVTSIAFVPNDYGALTFGTNDGANALLDLNNYFVSPNGDGVNDAFVLDELSDIPESTNNKVAIYDRFGLKVFEMENYTNDFVGFSNMNNFVIDREKGLPAGVYFYTILLKDMDKKFQGFLYLAR